MKNINILQLLKPKATISYLYEDNTLRHAAESMKIHGYTAVPVINRKGGYVKTFSEGDFLWFMLDKGITGIYELENYTVKDAAGRVNCEPVYVNSTIADLFRLSMNQNFVPVTDDRGVFIGIVTRRDILQVCYKAFSDTEMFSSAPEYETNQ